jgi:hypothetical protein
MLMNASLPDKLNRYRQIIKLSGDEPEKYETELYNLSRELIEIMETELICEGLLHANS